MANEAHRDVVFLIAGIFKREQRQHHIDGPGDAPQAILTPGPHRGADIMYGFYPGIAQNPLQWKIKIRRIHTDKYIRSVGKKIVPYAAADIPQFQITPEDLGNTHHGQLLHRVEQYAPRLAQPRTAYAGDLDVPAPFFQGIDQIGGKNVTGYLASNNTYTQHGLFSTGQ